MVGLCTSRGLMGPSGLSISSLSCFDERDHVNLGCCWIHDRSEMTHCRCVVRPIHP